MDSTAAAMCRDNHIPLLVFNLARPENIVDAVKRERNRHTCCRLKNNDIFKISI